MKSIFMRHILLLCDYGKWTLYYSKYAKQRKEANLISEVTLLAHWKALTELFHSSPYF